MGKVRTFLAIALPVSLSLGHPAAAQELWNGFLFGDSKDHVIKELPNSKIEHDGSKNSKPAIDYIISDEFGSAPCGLRVFFSFPYPSEKLTSVHASTGISLIAVRQEVRTQCARQILQGLLEKYGEPNQSGYDKDKTYRIAIWNKQSGVFIKFTYIELSGVNIFYSKDTPPTIIPFKDMKSAL